MTNNPSPQPVADREADRLAELFDRVADLREAVKNGNRGMVEAASGDVGIAASKADLNEDYGFALDRCLNAVDNTVKFGLSKCDRKALLHVVAAIEAIVEEEASERV